MRLPGREEALAILREAGCSEGVINHCLNVNGIAIRIAEGLQGKGLKIDLALVQAGALLHDLGRSRTHGIEHGVVGGEIAKELGLPNKLVRIIERHIGGGIPAEETLALGLPEKDYVPESLEEKVVSYADKLIEGDREVEFEVTLGKFMEELGEDHPGLDRMRALHEEISELLGVR
ncbi:MAG: TIGR00295 family protein [Candidatus Bathyarchaeota archaeon]